jgi:hypothetical protein
MTRRQRASARPGAARVVRRRDGLANPDTVTTATDLILDRASAPTL